MSVSGPHQKPLCLQSSWYHMQHVARLEPRDQTRFCTAKYHLKKKAGYKHHARSKRHTRVANMSFDEKVKKNQPHSQRRCLFINSSPDASNAWVCRRSKWIPGINAWYFGPKCTGSSGIQITTQTALTFTARVVPARGSAVEPYRELSEKKKRDNYCT